MSDLTVESVYLEQIWKVFEDANKNITPMLSGLDQDKIENILKDYRSKANELDTSAEALPMADVGKCVFCDNAPYKEGSSYCNQHMQQDDWS